MGSAEEKQKALLWSVKLVGLEPTEPSAAFSENLQQQLANYLDELIQHDFNKLIAILYRIDVSQEKIKQALENPYTQKTPGEILTQLIIARQIEKLRFRLRYTK